MVNGVMRTRWLRPVCWVVGHVWCIHQDDHRDHIHMDGETIAIVTHWSRHCTRCRAGGRP